MIIKNAPMIVLSTGISISLGLIIGATVNPFHVWGDSEGPQIKTVPIHLIQWYSLKGITLNHGEFLDLVDTTPMLTIGGHVAMYIPCDDSGKPLVQFLQGSVDVGKNTLAPVAPEYIEGLSSPGNSCLYHFDIGTPEGVTDFAIVNDDSTSIDFGERHTITFSIEEIKGSH
jgi:hypothetical protein